MGGFANDPSGNTIVWADNIDFSGNVIPSRSITADGQLLIGSTAAPNIKTGVLTSPLGTISIGYSAPNITLDLVGGATAIEKVNVQTGTSPIVPSAGAITINGALVAAGTNPVRSDGTGANTLAIEVQTSQALAAADSTKVGLSNFNNAQFSVDINGFVALLGGTTPAILGIVSDAHTAPGTTPVVPNGSGNVIVTGAQVAAGTTTNVIRTDSLAANTYTIEIQRSQAAAVSTIGDNGVSHFDSGVFTVDANGFVSLIGGAPAIEKVNVQTGTSPIVPSTGSITINGAVVAAGTNPIRSDGTGANTLAIEVQTSQALAAADATKIGLSNFDSARFTVDATGFVSMSGTGVGQTITGDSGGALSPTAGNWNILGGPGVTTSGSGSTLTINSVVFTDQGGSTSVTSDSGSYATAAIALTTPVAPAQGEVLEFVCTTASALAVTAAGTQKIRIGTLISSAGGTATSTAIGDSLVLRYRTADTTWYATSSIGVWVMA